MNKIVLSDNTFFTLVRRKDPDAPLPGGIADTMRKLKHYSTLPKEQTLADLDALARAQAKRERKATRK